MTLPPRVRGDVQGAQQPRISSLPPTAVDTAGEEAIRLARMVGLILDPWQELVLRASLGERDDGKWAAFQVGLVVGRQNGKNVILEARELYELFVVAREAGPRVVLHSAHLFKTAKMHYRRLKDRISSSPQLLDLVRRRGHRINGFVDGKGDEAIWLADGSVIYFVSRTGSGGQGRGLTGDLIAWDEAMNLPDAVVGDVMPTVSARTGPEFLPGPQIWYCGSAVNQQTMPYGLQFTRIRNAGISGDNESLAYFEWSVDDAQVAANPDLVGDPEAWALANPGLGRRISVEHVTNELEAMPRAEFLSERLGVGDWPDVSEGAGRIISAEEWEACRDPDSRRARGAVPVFVIDATPQRDWTTVGVAAPRADELVHVDVANHDRGTGWVLGYALELQDRHAGAWFIVDPRGPAASLIPDLRDHGVAVREISTADYARACAAFYDAVIDRRLRHNGRLPMLDAALAVAGIRPMGDAWAWKRREAGVPISPLVAVTLAYWAATTRLGEQPAVTPRAIFLDDEEYDIRQ
jgi:hypothetical protein